MGSSNVEVPVRNYMDDDTIVWRDGTVPDFSVVDKKYLKEKTMSHKAGSLEKTVENLVKTWEMESTHKPRAEDWKSIDPDSFTISVNHGQKFDLADNIALGNYNLLMSDSPLYDAEKETNDSALELFRSAFTNGFAWEVLEVYSGPPVVSFTWRHWGKWEGPYKDTPPSNDTIEMYGSCVARVTENQKIKSIEVFYDPNPLIATLTNFTRPSGCPYAQSKKAV